MLRDGEYKYIHYVDCEPELYNLERDPEELNNLAGKADYQKILTHYAEKLYSILDPKSVNSEALLDQAELIKRNGGVDKVLNRGGLNGTPVPENRPLQVNPY